MVGSGIGGLAGREEEEEEGSRPRPRRGAMATTVTTQRGPVSAVGAAPPRGPLRGVSCYRSQRWAGEARLGDPDGPARPLPGPLWEGDSVCPTLPQLRPRRRRERKSPLVFSRLLGCGGGKSASSPGSRACEEALGKGRGKSLLTARSPGGGCSARSLSEGLSKEGATYTEPELNRFPLEAERSSLCSRLGGARSGRCPWSCRLKAGTTHPVYDVGVRVGRELSRRKTNLPAFWEVVLTVYWEYVTVWFCPGLIIPHTGVFYVCGVTTSAFDRCAVLFCSSSLKESSSHCQYDTAFGETRVFKKTNKFTLLYFVM